ncbi:uncharacterized protein [Glycine max]|uniref:uncharacterized protein n=1 Tax=Glycine max TaxID=3847 RepID=UPI001B3561CA|nr:uncharacterized protein LOC102669029 [Glycine max]
MGGYGGTHQEFQVAVCLQCGNAGFPETLVFCNKCQKICKTLAMAIYVKSKQPPQSNVTTLIMKKVRNLVNDEESASKLPLNFQ